MMSADNPQSIDEIEQGLQSPLAYAISSQDSKTLDTVGEALRDRRVELAYQPIVQSRRPDRPAFFEAFIRIRDRNGRIIPARDFVASCETHEFGRQIDTLSLDLGMAALREVPSLRLSVNMSARSFAYPEWRRTLERAIALDPTSAERLVLEISETSANVLPDVVRLHLSELHLLGVSFALDNFGAGFTSLKYLRDFSFDILKIDGEFIRGIADSPDNMAMTRALIALARQFYMVTVAENVETEAEARWLIEAGIDCMQGFYFGMPTLKPHWLSMSRRKAG
jgi:EAL domain-containing protein (putative c-di-GMP-specific phosphodiesterase class I)